MHPSGANDVRSRIMSRGCTALWAGAALLLGGLDARGEMTCNGLLRAVPAPASVRMDGDLEEWDRSGAIVMADDTERPEQLVRVSAMFDAEALYLAMEFKDPTPMTNHVDPHATPGRAWCGDAVQLRFNFGGDGLESPVVADRIVHLDAYWYTDGGRPSAYVVHGDMAQPAEIVRKTPQAIGAGVEVAFRKDGDGRGYVQEMRIEWKLLCLNVEPPAAGGSFRLAIEAMWDNPSYAGEGSDRLVDLINPQRVERQRIWTNPPAFGTVQLVKENKVAADETAKLWPDLVARFNQSCDQAATRPAGAMPSANRPCRTSHDRVTTLLNQWFAEGSAAGNVGEYYDNRDRGHSSISVDQFPQLQRLDYTPAQLQQKLDYALFLGARSQVTFGNSSTSSRPEQGGCNIRHAMMQPTGMLQLYAQYRANNLYVYPAHHDYRPGHNGQGWYGDLLPLNSPCYILSLGSSGTDRPFLNAAIHTSAAFHPEVKRILIHHGLLMPTIQAILRASNTQVTKAEDYFSGKAHPAVFQGDQIDELKMIRSAHAMKPETIPPLAQVRVVTEEPLYPGVNAPERCLAERLCDTPAVVARVHRRWDRELRMKVSAADSFDWLDRPLQYRWVLLQGDAEKVRIKPSADGQEAELVIAWHDRFPPQQGGEIDTNRVDIAVFASAGQGWSAPAFVSVYHPDNELRSYDIAGRLLDIHYGAGDASIGFETPALLPGKQVPGYPIRDWPALLDLATSRGESLASRLLGESLDEREAAVLTRACENLKQRMVSLTATGGPATSRPAGMSRRDVLWCSKALTDIDPQAGRSAKAIVEGVLNRWIDDPGFYLKHQAAIEGELAARSAAARQKVDEGRKRLERLGIYGLAEGKLTVQSVVGGAEGAEHRLTQYERLELKRFHLLLLNEVVLPGVIHRPYMFNCVDQRLVRPEATWVIFDSASGKGQFKIVRRENTDHLPSPRPLEEP